MEAPTLRDLRTQSNLSIREIVDRMKAVEADVPQFRPGLIHLEKRGTDKLHVIRALAAAYELPFDVVADAAARSRKVSRSKLPN